MNYYTLRAMVSQRVRDWLSERTENPNGADSFNSFMLKMELEFGAPESMVKNCLRHYNLTVKDGELVNLNG